jgi:uncharacterized protein YjbI with pentapeptide repeats
VDVDLREANLENARLNGADLTDVLLSGANPRGAHFNEAKVRSVDFRHADLSSAAFHNALVVTSALDVRALGACTARLPDTFLQSVGYTPEEIHYLKTLYAQPIHSMPAPIDTAPAPP